MHISRKLPSTGEKHIINQLFASGPHMETPWMLAFAAILLFGSSLWLLAVRLNSASLQGVGWLSGFAALTGCSFVLASSSGKLPLILSVVAAAASLLLAHILLEVVIIEVTEAEVRLPLFGGLLAVGSVLLLLYFTYGRSSSQALTLVLCTGLMVQDSRNLVLLLRRSRKALRPATALIAIVLGAWTIFNAARIGTLGWASKPESSSQGGWHQNLTLLVTLGFSLALIAGFFWLATLQLTAKLEQMAGTDPLTRIANRRVFREWTEREILRSLRTGVPFSLLAMDLDHFKRVNDSLGHQAGDEVILTAVERMQDSIRGIDVLGRWGGEEFVALLPRANIEAAALVAERIRKNIERPFCVSVGGREPEQRLTVSLGVTTYRGEGDDFDKIFYRADKALYQAKSAGRNRFHTDA